MGSRQTSPDWPNLSNRRAAELFFLVALGLTAAAVRQMLAQGQGSGIALGPYSWEYVALIGLTIALAVAEFILLMLLWSKAGPRLAALAEKVTTWLARLGWLNALAALAVLAAYVGLVLWYFDNQFAAYLLRLWLLWLGAGIGAWFLLAWRKEIGFVWALMAVGVLFGFGLKAVSYLPEVTSHPFSLGWSEASRYYYASLPYAERLYGFPVPLSPWHPSRYLLLGLPFLIPGVSLFVLRAWQVILWLILSFLSGWALASRFQIRQRGLAVVMACWAGLFLLQGPVYYHLLISVILVLWGFDRQRTWKTLAFVILASAWAGISRVNWYPVPAFLAAALYLLEKPVREEGRGVGSWLRYGWPVAAWGVAGMLAAAAAQAVYIAAAGHTDTSLFGSTFTSALLWYRLFPSATYPKGVLPAILEVTGPLLILVGGNWVKNRRDWHPLRLLGLGGMALVLLVGGLVVSTKIGGGSNIHNLDAFIAFVLVVGTYVGFGHVASEIRQPAGVWRPLVLLLFVISMPVLWNMHLGQPFRQRNTAQAAYDLEVLNGIVQEYAQQGEVLFITQRQLETFQQVPGIRVVPDYELLTLSEMAISNNQTYLQRFYRDLENHRFSLIVADPQPEIIQDPARDAFAEENNAWVQNISPYILKNYEKLHHFSTQGIQIYVPRQ